ncbi:MAG: DUF3501 family protein [Burkholderiales bacterium]|jgi:hypothetical protein
MMAAISRTSLMSLEEYASRRKEFRARVMAHKHNRKIHLGEHVTLLFEDELTIRYQVQEMLRAERIFEEEGIVDELNAYNPLVPDGSNWKVTMLIEYPDEAERKNALGRLIDVEDKVWVRVGDQAKVYAIADEDLERETSEKTSSVHFLRFDLTVEMKNGLKNGQTLAMGIDHPNYQVTLEAVPEAIRQSLINDLQL